MNSTDLNIAKACLKGDTRAQRDLYEQYKVQMFRICLRYAPDRSQAEDILQDGFIKVFKSIGQYNGSGPLGGWIRTLMTRTALEFLRTKKRDLNISSIEISELEISEEQAEEKPAVDTKMLTKLIQELPQGYRVVFNMFVLEGYSHKEIAEVLGISLSTSKTQLFKAKSLLRKKLETAIVS